MIKPVADAIKVKSVVSGVLYTSDFYEVKNWEYDFKQDDKASEGYNDCLCVVYVKRGNFLFDLSKESYDSHSGHILIDKPNYEYRLRPSAGECSIFNFTFNFYRQLVEDCNLKYSFFFSNANILSLMLKAAPETEYLHHQIMKKVGHAGKLEMDNLVLELLRNIVATLTNEIPEEGLNASMRCYHLRTIEQAKEYINENFASDISLYELARHCCVSPFHFSRIFKKFTAYTPHQYLLNIRLKHGEMLLKNSASLVSDISFLSGFNSVEYFATAFKSRYMMSPSQFREKIGS